MQVEESSPKYKRYKKLLEKVQVMRHREISNKQKLQEKLNQLLEKLELEESEEHKEILKSEISHLEKILDKNISKDQNDGKVNH